MIPKNWTKFFISILIVTLVFLFVVKVRTVVAGDDCGDCPAGYYCRQNNNGTYSCKPNPTRVPTAVATRAPTNDPTHAPTVAPTQPGRGGPAPTASSAGCQACSTGACGACSDYASGWRCSCTGLLPNGYFTSCTGHLDSSCGVPQPTPTGVPAGMCNRCTTGACGACSDYASGWRCNCYEQVGNYYKTCLGELDTTCGVAQPTPTPPCTPRYYCQTSDNTCQEVPVTYTSADVQCGGGSKCTQYLSRNLTNKTTGICFQENNCQNKCICATKKIGDADCDGKVTLKDYFYYVAKKAGATLSSSVTVDFDGNGTVDDADRAIVIKTLKP